MSPAEATEALARRAVAAPGWRWMPGMLAARLDPDDGVRIVLIGGHMAVRPAEPATARSAHFPCVQKGDPHRHGRSWIRLNAHATTFNPWLPDLTDPATLGCLLALVREAYVDGEFIRVTPISDILWVVHGARNPDPEVDGLWVEGVSEAAALVAALEAAPRRAA